MKHKTWEEMIPNAPATAHDLLGKLFTYDPAARLSAKQVLEHPFFEELYDPQNDSQVLEGNPVNYYDFEFEQYTINSDIIRELLLDEIIMAGAVIETSSQAVLRRVDEIARAERRIARARARASCDTHSRCLVGDTSGCCTVTSTW